MFDYRIDFINSFRSLNSAVTGVQWYNRILCDSSPCVFCMLIVWGVNEGGFIARVYIINSVLFLYLTIFLPENKPAVFVK